MGKLISFSYAKSNIKVKEHKKDKDGYYYLPLGGLNIFNGVGDFYPGSEDVKKALISETELLQRRIRTAHLYGEVGHPQIRPGETMAAFYARNKRIDKTNVSHHIRSIDLVETDRPSELPGYGNVIEVWGWIKPAGVKGDALQKALDNKHENVAFSIRSFTDDNIVAGFRHKSIRTIITWDWVGEPGINFATEEHALSQEEYVDIVMDIDDIEAIGNSENCFACGIEDNDGRMITRDLLSKMSNSKSKVISRW